MTQGKTLKYEQETRDELLSIIGEVIDIHTSGPDVFLARNLPKHLRMEDTRELFTMPIPKLDEVAKIIETHFNIPRRRYEKK